MNYNTDDYNELFTELTFIPILPDDSSIFYSSRKAPTAPR